MRFALTAGLALRHGQQTLEVVRLLDDDRLVLEDVITRHPNVVSVETVLKKIWEKTYVVVHGDVGLGAAKGSPADASRVPQTHVDLASLPDAWVQEIERRMAFVKAVQAAHVSEGSRQQVGRIAQSTAKKLGMAKAPSVSTVMDWLRRYGRSGHNPLALISHRKTAVRKRVFTDEVELAVERVLRKEYFTRARHSLRHAHDVLRRELARLVRAGELAPEQADVSRSSLRRRVLAVDAYHRIASREGEARARVQTRTPIDGGAALYPLQRIEIDHTPLNWVVVCERTGLPLGRPLLTFAVDAYSSYVLGMYLSFYGPGVTSVCGVMRALLQRREDLQQTLGLKNRWLSHGLPDEVVLDNGLEFHSRTFKTMCWNLGVDMTFCRVRTPWLKPHVERHFGGLDWLTLNAGRVRKKTTNSLNVNPYDDACVTFSDLVKGLMMYIVDVHPFEVNHRKLATPYSLMVEGLAQCPPAGYPEDSDSIKMISGMSKLLTVSHGGVELTGLPYGGPELLALRKRVGEKFKAECRWDPDDMSTMFVQDPQDSMKWIRVECMWREYAEGLSWNQHRIIREFKRKNLASSGGEDALWKARMSLHDFWSDAARPRTRADSLQAARYAGYTSSRVLAGGSAVHPSVEARQIVAAPSLVLSGAQAEIPDFESFDLEAR